MIRAKIVAGRRLRAVSVSLMVGNEARKEGDGIEDEEEEEDGDGWTLPLFFTLLIFMDFIVAWIKDSE